MRTKITETLIYLALALSFALVYLIGSKHREKIPQATCPEALMCPGPRWYTLDLGP